MGFGKIILHQKGAVMNSFYFFSYLFRFVHFSLKFALMGLRRDLEAVKNAASHDYNDGLAEGSVNKLKLVKRKMYGSCSFETLRKKMLLQEYYKISQQT